MIRGTVIRDATASGKPAKKKLSTAPRENIARVFKVNARKVRNRNVAIHAVAAARPRPALVETRNDAGVPRMRTIAQKIAAVRAPVAANTSASPGTPSMVQL